MEEACPGRGLADSLAPQELAGLLATTYHDASLESAVLTSRVTVDRDLLRVVSSAGARVSYPYGAGLFVYNEAQGRVYRLQNADQAGRYFLTYADRTRACS